MSPKIGSFAAIKALNQWSDKPGIEQSMHENRDSQPFIELK